MFQQITNQEKRRVNMGLQCPGCCSVLVTARMSRFQAQPEGFSCDTCGDQWKSDYYRLNEGK